MSVLSGTSIDDNYNDDEEIEEVEEIEEHVHIISRKYEATSFNCEGPNPPKPYKPSRYGIANSNSRRLEFVSISKKRNAISGPENLTCDEEIFEE
eukprot:scaffold230413_cov59-Attheya_sp.AAC.1